MTTTLTTIGGLTLDAIGTARVRTEYEGATIEGVVMGLDLDIEINRVRTLQDRTIRHVGHIDVTVGLRLGNIDLRGLRRSHPCEVIA